MAKIKENIRQLQGFYNRYSIIIPRTIVELAGYEKADELKFEFCGQGKICLEKIEKEKE